MEEFKDMTDDEVSQWLQNNGYNPKHLENLMMAMNLLIGMGAINEQIQY